MKIQPEVEGSYGKLPLNSVFSSDLKTEPRGSVGEEALHRGQMFKKSQCGQGKPGQKGIRILHILTEN